MNIKRNIIFALESVREGIMDWHLIRFQNWVHSCPYPTAQWCNDGLQVLMANLLLAAGGKGSISVGGGGSSNELTNWDGMKKRNGWGIMIISLGFLIVIAHKVRDCGFGKRLRRWRTLRALIHFSQNEKDARDSDVFLRRERKVWSGCYWICITT